MEMCFKESGYLKKSTDGTTRCSGEDSPLSALKKMLPQESLPSTHRLEYTLNYKSGEYEERVYRSATWVCTTVSSIYQDAAIIEGFRKIQAYVKGKNAAGANLAIEPPIVTRVTSTDDFSFERTFMVCVYLTSHSDIRHPIPTDRDVLIKRLPAMTVFVRSFTGVSSEERWTLETRRLTEILSHQEDVRTDCYLTAIYHSPFQLSANQNEVWLLKYQHKSSSKIKPVGEENMIQIGNRHIETSSLTSSLINCVLTYFCVLVTLGRAALQTVGFLIDNKDTIVRQTKIVSQCVTPRKVSKTLIGVTSAGWTIGKACVNGLLAENNGTQREIMENTEYQVVKKLF